MAGQLSNLVIGVDEAGRGPLAGPVVAAAVILCDGGIAGLNDSKKLSEKRRIALEAEIKARCHWALGVASVAEIDAINILQATMLAMTRAVEGLGVAPTDAHQVLVDGNRLPKWSYTAQAIVGGDALEPAISAASIIAKQARDAMMVTADTDYPGYGFAKHKGYGTAQHMAALRTQGPCPLHRQSFAPIAQLRLL